MHFRSVVPLLCVTLLWCVCGADRASGQTSSRRTRADLRFAVVANENVAPVNQLFGRAILNPSKAAPLTAEIPFVPDKPGTLSITITCPGNETQEVPHRLAYVPGRNIRLPIVGLHAGCANRIVVTLFDKHGKRRGSHVAVVKTSPVPDDFPTVTASGTYGDDAFTFVTYFRMHRKGEGQQESLSPGFGPRFAPEITGIMFDKGGRVRWYSDFTHQCLFPMEFVGGHIYGGDWIVDTDILHWYDLMGRQVGSVDLGPMGFTHVHHDVIKRPNGNLIVTADKINSDLVGDYLIEIDPTNGTLVRSWDLGTVLPDVADLYIDVPMTGAQIPGFTNDPIHVNGVAYDPADGGIIVCSQRSGVAKLHADGTLAWILAPHLTCYIDDTNGDGVSDSFAADYDPGRRRTWAGDYTSDGYGQDRMPVAGNPVAGNPVAGNPVAGYPFDFSYREFLLAPHDGSGNAITDKDVLLGFADSCVFRWPFRPHAPRLLQDGTLLLFDNGLMRGFKPIGEHSFSRAVLYRVAPDTDGYGGSVTQTAEYVLKSEPKWYRFSPMVGEVDQLADGTLLCTLGGLGSGLYLNHMMDLYGDGPRGAYIAQIDATTGDELHSLAIERPVNNEHPSSPFSVYRAERIRPYEVITLPEGLTLLNSAD